MRRRKLPSEKHLNATHNDGGGRAATADQVESVKEKQQSLAVRWLQLLKQCSDHHRQSHDAVLVIHQIAKTNKNWKNEVD